MKTVREACGDMLVLDVGDVVPDFAGYAEVKAEFFARALPYMGYDTVGMGESEVRLVSEGGKLRPYGDSVAAICANVADASTGKLLATQPYIVRKTPAGLGIGIISVLGDELIDAGTRDKLGIRVLPPAETLRQYLGEIRKESDLVILLSHTGLEEAKQLAGQVAGIDVILSGHSSFAAEGPERVGNTLLMQARWGGGYVGKLVLDIGADRKISSFAGEYVAMDRNLEDDPEIAKLTRRHDADMLQYYTDVRERGQREPRPFVSSSKCRECHVKEYDSWSSTAHARAFESLRKDNRTADPDCAVCHTTGFTSKGGFTSEVATPQLRSVQCEACHGPGAIHAGRPAEGYGAVSRAACTQCHNPANSPEFDYEEYKKRIVHEKH